MRFNAKEHNKKIQIIVTLGPSTASERDLRIFKDNGVDFVRLNMSHSSLKDLERSIKLAKKVGVPFIVDTEGSQVRTDTMKAGSVEFVVGDTVRIYAKPIKGTREAISLNPSYVVEKLLPGDILYCDFNSLAICVADVKMFKTRGYLMARVVSGGSLGSNKGVFVDLPQGRYIHIPTLTAKDHESIKIGLKHNVSHIAASFMRSGEAVREVRRVTKGRMKIISKIECIDGLQNLDEIIKESDSLLVDRGDLSKEIFINRIPFTQKIIVHRARRRGKPVILATNFLESMIHNRMPTRAEIHDIESSITDGATGLTLAAETAIGKYPFECLGVMNNVINHITLSIDVDKWASKEEELVAHLEDKNYLLNFDNDSPLVSPHGGKLIERYRPELLKTLPLKKMSSLILDEMQEMDVEQLALGAYSPLEGFMGKKELKSVLNVMRLPTGVIWSLPIVLTTSTDKAKNFKKGEKILLKDKNNKPLAVLNLEDKYTFDKSEYAKKLYGTLDERHPGVHLVMDMGEVFLAGKVNLLRRRDGGTKEFELTPAQTRRLFESLGWGKVVGFHTRNVIHRGHEHVQMKAMEDIGAHGLFVHPVVGKKKSGDFLPEYIATSYEIMIKKFYPKNKVIFGTFPTYSRYAGPKEALFTAIVRQNFGCSHFIVGRDHTGVGDFYHPEASHKIFDTFPDLEIKLLRFNEVFYSKKLKHYVVERQGERKHPVHDKLFISGTEARKILERGHLLPEWFMRKEISQMIVDAINKGKQVFER